MKSSGSPAAGMVTLMGGIPGAVLLFPKTALGLILDKVDITSCYDGDTCTSSTGEKVRLACIDTPE